MDCPFPPGRLRRLERSSVIDAARTGAEDTPWPDTPRAPRNAPVPPTMAILEDMAASAAPGAGGTLLPENPSPTRVPIGVPSSFRISHVRKALAPPRMSAIAPPGAGFGWSLRTCSRRTWVPLAGWPLTATMSEMYISLKNLLREAVGLE